MRDETFHRIIHELKPFLVPYIEAHDIEFSKSGKIPCINSNHDDQDPSMSLVPGSDNQVLHCFGCGASYNIFHAAVHLEEKDSQGVGFLTETIPFLAEKFGIDFNKDDLELSEEALVEYRYRHLYNDAAEVLREIGTYEHTTEREWNEAVCKEHIVASVGWDDFCVRLQNRGGYTKEEIESKGINDRLFNSALITFVIRDHRGRVCGFVARNTLYRHENRRTYPKYNNTGNDVPIYKKKAILYGLHVAANHPEKRLDIFEGYPDWFTAQACGYRNCAAIGGVELTNQHIDLLHEIGFRHINLLFDDDTTGQTKMEGHLDKYCGMMEDMRVTVMKLPFTKDAPKDERDPDHYFKTHSVKEYLQVPVMTAFDWRLNKAISKLKKEVEEETIAEVTDHRQLQSLRPAELIEISKTMVPYIVSEPSAIEQGRMSRLLAEQTGVKEYDIREEVKARGNRQVREISENMQSKLRRAKDSIDIKEIVERGMQKIESVTTTKDLSSFNNIEVAEHLGIFYQDCDDSEKKPTGWMTGWDIFDSPMMMGGIPKKDSIITMAGSPNHGKSALLMNIAKQLVLPEQKNEGLSTMIWYLDDPRNVAWAKMLASMTALPILDVRNPWREVYKDQTKKKMYDGWKDYMRGCVADKKLLIKGHEIGNDIESLQYWIKYVQDTTGNNVLVFVDAIHDMMTGQHGIDNDMRMRYVRIMEWIEESTENDKYTFLTCAHITKHGMAKGKPEQIDLSETGKLQFSSKLIGMVYSELDHFTSIHKRNDSIMYWNDPDEKYNIDRRKPIIEFTITKNKEGAGKGTRYFKHKADACFITPLSSEEVDKIRTDNEAAIESRPERVRSSSQNTTTVDIMNSFLTNPMTEDSFNKGIGPSTV